MRWIKLRSLSVVSVLMMSLVFIGLQACQRVAATTGRAAPQQQAGGVSVERGEYLTKVMSCHDCHTPFKMGPNGPEADMSRMLSGHPQELVMPPAPPLPEGPWMYVGAGTNTAFAGPWGLSYSSNITPDENTGLGIWTEEMFMQAIRTGRHMGQSRPLLPPMPWNWFANLTDDDLKSVYAYLRTIPAIENRVPDAVPAGQGEAEG